MPEKEKTALPRKKKPPIGVVPALLHDESRQKELWDAIARYLEAGDQKIPLEWVSEYNDILDRQQDRADKGHATKSIYRL